MPGITQQSEGEQGALGPPAELLIFLLPRGSPHWGASPPFEGQGINKHNGRKPHLCNNAPGKSPWLPLPALSCSSAKPTSPPNCVLTSVGSCPRHSSHLSHPCRGRGGSGSAFLPGCAAICKSLKSQQAAGLGPAWGRSNSRRLTPKMLRLQKFGESPRTVKILVHRYSHTCHLLWFKGSSFHRDC